MYTFLSLSDIFAFKFLQSSQLSTLIIKCSSDDHQSVLKASRLIKIWGKREIYDVFSVFRIAKLINGF